MRCFTSHYEIWESASTLRVRSQRSTFRCWTIVVASYENENTEEPSDCIIKSLNISESFIEDCRSRLYVAGVAFCPCRPVQTNRSIVLGCLAYPEWIEWNESMRNIRTERKAETLMTICCNLVHRVLYMYRRGRRDG